jgi:hypothetical protein
MFKDVACGMAATKSSCADEENINHRSESPRRMKE